MSTRDIIKEILEDMHPEIDFETASGLAAKRILVSFDLISLRGDLEEEFDIEIGPRDFIEDNFDTLDTLTAMVERLVEE